MSSEESRTLWCLVEGDPRPYDVFDIPIDASVARLKAKIKERIECLRDTDADSLKLLKLNVMVPIDPHRGLAQRLADLGNIDMYSTELSSGEEVVELFPEPPSKKHLHIVVQRIGIALSSPSVPPDQQSQKERLNELLPSEVDLRGFHLALQVIDASPDWYSNIHNLSSLPFPMLYGRLPTDRFPLSEEPVMMFEYMGRERFGSLWDKVQSFRLGSGSSQLFLYGNMGSGKSHMLAALACLLFHLGKRPVYLPDCRQMLTNPLPYIQSAMLCSFADPSSLARRDEIRSFQNMDDASKFCGNLNTRLYFIVDQINALEQEEINADPVSNSAKQDLWAFLRKIAVGHYRITSASANYKTFRHTKQKQTTEIKMSMMGGMSKAEMKQWWVHHEGKLPIFERESDKGRVEDLTGRIPLLLRPLLGWKGQNFCDIQQQFWHHRELAMVKTNILNFDQSMIHDHRKHALYIDSLFACLLGSVHFIRAECFDHRYFWRDEETGRCHYTCGLAREGGAITIRKVKPDKFLSHTWLNALDAFEDNPVVVGFVVKQTCLSAISHGLNIRGLHWKSLKPNIFAGDILDAISLEASQALYIPDQWNYKDFDALYLYMNKQKKTVLIVPIQIFINPLHKDSEACFYTDWQRWVKHYKGYTLSSTFVWIVEHDRSWNIVDEQLRAIRGGTQLIAPLHEQMLVTVGDVYGLLGERLAQARQSGQPSPKMIESARQNELEIVGEYFSEATEELFKSTLVDGEGSSKRKTRSNKKATPASRRMKQLVNDDDEC
ncbi:hypothetical protein F5887DRAFT_994782 [Amanita rubescens]|nr:hypothetical protein F5887DRAFT_994782 [Amanita rubescens]